MPEIQQIERICAIINNLSSGIFLRNINRQGTLCVPYCLLGLRKFTLGSCNGANEDCFFCANKITQPTDVVLMCTSAQSTESQYLSAVRNSVHPESLHITERSLITFNKLQG